MNCHIKCSEGAVGLFINKIVCSFKDNSYPFLYSPEGDNVLYSLHNREVIIGSKVEVLLYRKEMGMTQAKNVFMTELYRIRFLNELVAPCCNIS